MARGPRPPPPGHRLGFPADQQLLRPSIEHCSSLILAGEEPAGGSQGVCGGWPSPSHPCYPHLPLPATPVTGPPQFPAWLGRTPLDISLHEVFLPPQLLGHPKGQCWVRLRNTEQPWGEGCSLHFGQADLA